MLSTLSCLGGAIYIYIYIYICIVSNVYRGVHVHVHLYSSKAMRVLLCKLNTTILSPAPVDKRTIKPNLPQRRSCPTLHTVVAFHHVTLPLPVLPLHAAQNSMHV